MNRLEKISKISHKFYSNFSLSSVSECKFTTLTRIISKEYVVKSKPSTKTFTEVISPADTADEVVAGAYSPS